MSGVSKASLGGQVSRGLGWSALNNVLVRVAGLGVGVLLARLLSPEQFGVYAVALTVQMILVTLAELGISADLIRRGEIDRRGPTVATLGLIASSTTALLMACLAAPAASLLGSEAAAPVVRVMSLTVVLSGIGVVPYAVMQRNFMQSRQLLVDATGLVVSTAVTVGLILVGVGPMALAVGRVASQAVTTAMQFRMTRRWPRFGWDREVARPALVFGAPVAGANLLSWIILNVDNMMIGHRLGATALGIYVLAFNLSTWPMNAVGLTIRSVALPAFSRLDAGNPSLGRALSRSTALVSVLTLPMGALLILFAAPLVELLYGSKWAAAGPVVAALGAFAALRVLFDLFASFLYARGDSRSVLVIQVLWLVGLAPAMVVGLSLGGLVGAAWAHVVVGAGILLPAYLLGLRRRGVAGLAVLRGALVPALACLPAAGVALLVTHALSNRLLVLGLGTACFLLCYAAGVFRTSRRVYGELRSSAPEPGSGGAEVTDRLPEGSRT